MAKAKQNLNLKIQMLAGKGTKEFCERFYKNLTSLVSSCTIASRAFLKILHSASPQGPFGPKELRFEKKKFKKRSYHKLHFFPHFDKLCVVIQIIHQCTTYLVSCWFRYSKSALFAKCRIFFFFKYWCYPLRQYNLFVTASFLKRYATCWVVVVVYIKSGTCENRK